MRPWLFCMTRILQKTDDHIGQGTMFLDRALFEPRIQVWRNAEGSHHQDLLSAKKHTYKGQPLSMAINFFPDARRPVDCPAKTDKTPQGVRDDAGLRSSCPASRFLALGRARSA
jgi:hypothetical protein